MLSSSAHRGAPSKGIELDNLSGERSYGAFRAYGQSKLANLLFARELSERFEGTYKTANAVHPGVINTGLTRYMNPVTAVGMAIASPLFLKSIPEGAATQTYVATHPSLDGVSGKYFADCNVASTSKHGQDLDLAKRLWEASEELAVRL
jgi:NAD(P)-dependent dehydrogenase (short-subunit alcohol dehydrogenase family)